MYSIKNYYHKIDIYKKVIWLYIFLLFIEGAMRKWFMPDFQQLWMICREPLAIWLVYKGNSKGYIKDKMTIGFMAIGSVCFLTTMFFGHQNLEVALYGLRIWLFHFPLVFILPKALNREDLMLILKFLVITFVPMTLIYLIQWASPPNTIINAKVGGEIGESNEVAYGAVRPSGIFGALGSSYYNPIISAVLIVIVLSKYYKNKLTSKRFNIYLLVICLLITLITSVSRATIVQSVFTFLFITFLMSFYGRKKIFGKIFAGTILVGVSLVLLSNVKIGGKGLFEPITNRFEQATITEGGTDAIIDSRIIYPYLWYAEPNKSAFDNEKDQVSAFGRGLGMSSNFGSVTLTGSYSWMLGEWSSQQVTQEMGLLFGTIIFFMRFLFPIFLFLPCIRILKRNFDILPISLWTLSIQYFSNGNINITTSLGFIVLLMTLLLTSIKTTEKIEQ